MIDEFNNDRTGWARFSDDRTMRYRFARNLNGLPLHVLDDVIPIGDRVTFVMLNPSTADAFKHDPTVGECIKRTRSLGADVLEVVNLFALRSPHPADLKKRAFSFRGDDQEANNQIMYACSGAVMVIAAWGNHGALDHRASVVTSMLRELGVKLHCLGTTEDGHPKHPLARGKHRIPGDIAPTLWEAT